MAKVLTLDDANVDGKPCCCMDINSPLEPATKTFMDDTEFEQFCRPFSAWSKPR